MRVIKILYFTPKKSLDFYVLIFRLYYQKIDECSKLDDA